MLLGRLCLYLFIFLPLFTFAHPHTFIDVHPSIEIKDKNAIKIHFKWVIDEMTSSMLIMETDFDGNGKYDKKENENLRKNYFSSLVEFGFYTQINFNNKYQDKIIPKNFQGSVENHKLCYSFDVELSYAIKGLAIDFADKDFLVAMILKKEFVKISGAKPKISNLDNEYYFGYRLEFE